MRWNGFAKSSAGHAGQICKSGAEPYGVGERMDIDVTRSLVRAALNGELEKIDYRDDDLFHIQASQSCSEVPAEILNPRDTWPDKQAFDDQRAAKLARAFAAHFDKAYGQKNIAPEVVSQCLGK